MPGGPGKINEYDKSLTACERKAKARKGGLASGKSRREKAYIRRIAEMVNDAPARTDLQEALAALNVDGRNFTNAAAIALAVFQAAVNGDMKAVDKWERYVGQADSGAGSGKVMIIDDV